MKHKHHKIPRHMGGSDDDDNLVELTIDEHALAHKELYEKYGKHEDYIAWKCLSGMMGKDEFLAERAKLGGKTQGTKNVESGHMAKIQPMSKKFGGPRKGGLTTMSRGKGAFADPLERLKSATKGGLTQGKRNAESGHLKRIAQLPNRRSSGMIWITNGVTNRMVFPTDGVPEGWTVGMAPKKKKL